MSSDPLLPAQGLQHVFTQEEAMKAEIQRLLWDSVPPEHRTVGLLSSRAVAVANSCFRFVRGVGLASGLPPQVVDRNLHELLEFLHNQICGVEPLES